MVDVSDPKATCSINCEVQMKPTWHSFAGSVFSWHVGRVNTVDIIVIWQCKANLGGTRSSVTVNSHVVILWSGTVIARPHLLTVCSCRCTSLASQLRNCMHVSAGSLHSVRFLIILERWVQRVQQRHCFTPISTLTSVAMHSESRPTPHCAAAISRI